MTTDVDTQVKAIAERKALVFTATSTDAKVKPTLTPVGTERKVVIPDIPEVFLTAEAVADIAKDLRAQAATLIAVADGLDRWTPEPFVAAPRSTPVEARLAGVEPTPPRMHQEPNFVADYAAKQKAAQDATFAPTIDLAAEAKRIFAEDAPSGSPVPGWVCPAHGDRALRDMTSRRGRAYKACAECAQFEKEVQA